MKAVVFPSGLRLPALAIGSEVLDRLNHVVLQSLQSPLAGRLALPETFDLEPVKVDLTGTTESSIAEALAGLELARRVLGCKLPDAVAAITARAGRPLRFDPVKERLMGESSTLQEELG